MSAASRAQGRRAATAWEPRSRATVRNGPDVGDEVGPAANQGFSAAQNRSVGLPPLAPVHDGSKERGIEPSHPGEIGGIGAIVLAVVSVDESEHARVGDDDSVTEVSR
jgi:hypothetical protein